MVLIFFSITLTLEEAIERMLKVSESSMILNYKMRVEQKVNSYNWSSLLPSIESNLSYSKMYPTKNESYSIGLSGSQNLSIYNFLQGVEAYYNNNESEFNYYYNLNELIYNTITLYLNCYTAEKLLEVRKKAVERSEYYKSKVDEMFKLGSASRADLLKAEVSNLQAQLEYIKAEKTQKELISQFKSLLDINEDVELSLPTPDIFIDSLNVFKDKVLKDNFELIAMRNSIASMRLKLAENITQYLPSIYLRGNYGYSGSEFPDSKEEWDLKDSYSIGFGLSMPIFAGFKRINNTIVQKMQLDIEVLNLKKKEKDILLEIENSYNNYLESRKMLEISEKNVLVATESMEATRLRFEMGEASIIELLSSEEDLLNAHYNLELAMKEYLLSIYKIKKIEGRIM